ncbi:MAG: hypothetical protein JWO40_860 [Candidatus Doudnabacteria bacterium]|nr:hypothetical protein [Candidatus Doudnabacteria bacterium]
MVSIGFQTHAATDTTTTTPAMTTASPNTSPARQFDRTKGGHIGQNGVKETLLTGDVAAKANAAALAAVPGATIDRAENDAEGATYEVHMTKSDGSEVTVKLDGNFNVTATEAGGHGHGHLGAVDPTDAADSVK